MVREGGVIELLTRETLIKNKGKVVDLDFLKKHILDNYDITVHALDKMKSRVDKVKLYDEDIEIVKQNILKSLIDKYGKSKITLAYINTDGSINVAITPYDYYVFDLNKDETGWTLITFKEKSWNSINIFEKLKLARQGIDGKYLKDK